MTLARKQTTPGNSGGSRLEPGATVKKLLTNIMASSLVLIGLMVSCGDSFIFSAYARNYLSNECAITFDGGPYPLTTRKILSIANERGVPLTYFPNGVYAALQPDVVRDFVQSGHEIGNGGLYNTNMTKLSRKDLRAQISRATEILKSIADLPVLFRPPQGQWSEEMVSIASAQELETVLWNFDTQDRKLQDADKIVARVRAKMTRNIVLLLHAAEPETVKALPRVIDALEENGCSFVTLSDWLALMYRQGRHKALQSTLPDIR